MAGKHSFVITLSNNITEKEGINYLVENYDGYYRIDKTSKAELLKMLNIDKRFQKAFDLIHIPSGKKSKVNGKFLKTYLEDIILVELKTTKKYLPENPKGFFFGATENEFNFGKILGSKFRFCFVSMHEKGSSISLLTVQELEERIRTRRIQFQINL